MNNSNNEKFKIDHDYHIHSKLSPCAKDEAQTTELILQCAKKNNFKEICLTDHFWDDRVEGASKFYTHLNYETLALALPLPQNEDVKFYFGCETELDKNMRLAISKEMMDKFDFIIIPTTHLHMKVAIDETKTSVEDRAKVYVQRLDKLLDMDLPFHKIGIAHLTCQLIAHNWKTDWDEHIRIIDAIDDKTFTRLFTKLAEKGAGFELNIAPKRYSSEELERILRPYRIAKSVGCKFYLGADAHYPNQLEDAPEQFADIVELLDLKETDRFRFN